MKMYLLSLAAGLLVGIIYSLLLVGEQVIPVAKQLLAGTPFSVAWHGANCTPHIFGELPGRHPKQLADTAAVQSPEIRS